MFGLVGYVALAVSRLLHKRSRARTILRTLGLVALLGTPSYRHAYDAFAVLGILLTLAGMQDALGPLMAMYYVAGLPDASHTTWVFAFRASVAVILALGVENPLLQKY